MEQIKQLLIAVLQKMNLWEQNAKSIDELPDAPNVIPLAKIHISDNGTSKALELQKLIDASLSSAVNQITSIGEITVDGNDVTVPIATWKIANVGYSTIAPTVINVPFSAAGTTRIDVFVANTSNQIVKISGNDTTGISIRPNLPLNTVIVTEINVSESALTPVPFPLTSDEIAAIQNANTPSATNPFATMDDIVAGGVSQLVDLTDVEIVSLTDGQVLVWDEADSKWKNQTVAGAGTPTLQQVTDEGNTLNDGDYSQNFQANFNQFTDLTTSEQVAFGINGIGKNDSSGMFSQQINFEEITANGTLIIPNTNGKLTTEDWVTSELSSEITKCSFITITQAVNLDDIETRVNELDAAVVLKGTWSAASGSFPSGAQAGWSYLVTTNGTIDSVEFASGDRLICVLDNASTTTYAGNWYKADYTDRVNTVAGRTGNVVITSSDLSDFNSAVNALITSALASFKTANFLDFTSSGQTQLDALNIKTRVLRQASDITRSDTTLVNTDISFSVEANSIYHIQGWIIGGGNSSGGIRVSFSLPAGCSGSQSIAVSTNLVPNGIGGATNAFAPGNNNQQSLYNGCLITGSNAGTATLQFSSAVASQTGLFRTNSVFTINKQ